MAKRKINLRYIRRVLKFIESDLRRFEMRFYLRTYPDSVVKDNPDLYAECGTQACFAGWGYLLQFPKKQWHTKALDTRKDIGSTAAQLFGFTRNEAIEVFEGNGLCSMDHREQLEYLKGDINKVLEDRGMKQSV